MANAENYKKLAQLYNTMGKDIFHKHMLVEEILKDYHDIDYKLPMTSLFELKQRPLLNSTALELAVKKNDIEVFKILLQCGADFTRKNEHGCTILHQIIDPNEFSRNLMPWTVPKNPFAESVLNAHVESLNSSNPCDKHGLSHFHVACITNHAEAVEFFLNNGVSTSQAIGNDSPIFPGFTPLQLAAKFSFHETLDLLLRTNVDVVSTVQLLVQEKMKIWIELTKAIRHENENHASDLQGYFDANERTTDALLRKIHPQKRVIDESTGLSRFHVACTTMDRRVVREQLFDNLEDQRHVLDLQHKVSEKSALWPGFAAHYEFRVFRLLLDEGASLDAVDARGETPFDVCLRNFELHEIVRILRPTKAWENVRFSNGGTRLLDFVDEALQHPGGWKNVDAKSFVPNNAPFCRGYTPLHVAVACRERLRERRIDEAAMNDRYRRCVEECLRLGADVTAGDARGSTPLHLAFDLEDADTIGTLLDGQTSDENPKDAGGLSHLHLAALTNRVELARRLPSEDLNARVEFVKANSFGIESGDTPYKIALRAGNKETAVVLIERGAIVDEMDIETMMIDERTRQQFVDRVPKILVEKLEDHVQLRDRPGMTGYHLAVLTGDLGLMDDADVDAKVPDESPVWAGCTALHLLVAGRRFAKACLIAERLIERGADVTARNADGATTIHAAFDWFVEDNDVFNLVDLLLSHLQEFNVNPVDFRGISHFHIASALNRVDVVEEFLQNNVDVEGKVDYFSDKYAGFTALHLAVARGCHEVIEILLAHGANVHCESVVGDCPIHLLAAELSTENEDVMKRLISAGADINARNLFGETPLEQLLKSSGVTAEKVELFLKYGCDVNIVNSMSHEGCLAMGLKVKDKSIYRSLLNVYDCEKLDEFGRSAMHNVLLLRRPSWEDLERSTIDEMFIPVEVYIKAIRELNGMGLDINAQDLIDMTPLHVAAMFQNVTGIIALLKCGADVNVNEMKGLPPITASMGHALKLSPVKQLDCQILENFWMHVWKLRFFDLHVSDFNAKAEGKIHGRRSFKENVVQSCHEEVRSMEKEKIGSIALRDFLRETGVVAAYRTMLFETRRAVDEFFEANFDRLREEYPELSCLLLLQYGKARKRLDMAESSTAALKVVLRFEMPRLCSDMILRSLTYDEIKNLIESANVE